MFRAAVSISFFFFALTPYVAFAMTDAQKTKIHDHFMKIGMECMKDTPINEADMKSLKNREAPTGENAPCFIACVMKNIGMIDEQGMLQKESVLELSSKVFEDPEEIKNIEEYLHSCAHINKESVSDGDKGCDRAMLALKCMNENASKFGFDF